MIQTGKLVVNLDVRVVSVDDKPVRLTGKEYGVLELLCLRKGSIVTKEMLLSFRWLCQSRISAIDRDRGTPRGATPPPPPGIRVRTTAVRPG
jgi:DNA-binding response OmpR family regulator